MNDKMPRTPFSTQLSRSAKETEIRIRNIFSGPKKRPPVLFLALMCLIALSCGDLVSCQVKEAEAPDVSDQPASSQQGDGLLDSEEQALLDALFQAAEEEHPFQVPHPQLLDHIRKDGWALGVVFVEDHLENTLILGVMNQETGEVSHGVFQRSVHNGLPQIVTFRDREGEPCLLYTFNGQENGQYDGQAGVVRLAGEYMEWQWPVVGDARFVTAPPDGPVGVYSEYEAYWNGHLALLAPGGVDVYAVNPDFRWGKEDPWSMWQLDSGETFWYDSSSAEELPMPIYFQSLSWLNEQTNDPGGWRVLSLTLNEEKCDPESQVDCFTLWAHTDDDQNEFTADLYFPYEQEGARRSYGGPACAKIGVAVGHPEVAPADQPGKEDWDWDWEDEKWEAWDEEWEKEQEARQIAEYQSVGVTMDGKDYWYQGQLVNIFLDQRPDKSVYTLNNNPAGTVNIKILRNQHGEITGAAYLTDAETVELGEMFED